VTYTVSVTDVRWSIAAPARVSPVSVHPPVFTHPVLTKFGGSALTVRPCRHSTLPWAAWDVAP
jgi:hypothetical protein